MDFDTVIIGAGLSGLAAGVRLAHFGERVCILEKHHVPGGLNSFYGRGGLMLDAGLHAITNAADDGRGLFYKLLRQLRIRRDELQICPQRRSVVRLANAELRFSNRLDDVQHAVAAISQADAAAFSELCESASGFDPFAQRADCRSARRVLAATFADQRLVEVLLCPVMSYGCPRQHDMDYHHFLVLFDGIFLQGLCRPAHGMASLVTAMVRRVKESGGELWLGQGVRSIQPAASNPPQVLLDNGDCLTAGRIISSAGFPETLALCGDTEGTHARGELSVIESIFILDQHPAELAFEESTLFFNHRTEFQYAKPDGLFDEKAGVICAPANFVGNGGEHDRFTIRLTRLANCDDWLRMTAQEYRDAKAQTVEKQLATVETFMPDVRHHVCGQDTFTPRTIRRFTGHFNGALYGTPDKQYSGETPYENVFVCGADQGFPGIVGALLSGVTMANRFLKAW